MIQFTIKLRPDLYVQSENNKITIKIANKAYNGLKIEGDGLFMEDQCGFNDDGFIDQSGDGLRIGFDGPYSELNDDGNYPKPGMIAADTIVHHMYTMNNDLKTLDGYRSVDCILPGDIIRVPKIAIQEQEQQEELEGIGAVEEANLMAEEITENSNSLTTGFKPRLTDPANTNKFYILKCNGGYSPCIAGSPQHRYLTALNNCVGYAWGRFHEIDNHTGDMYYYPKNPPPTLRNVKAEGKLKTGTEPKVGAAIIWGVGEGGHIAIVEKITSRDSSGKPTAIVTSESGYGCSDSFWTSNRERGNGNWGDSRPCLGFFYHPNVTGGDYDEETGEDTPAQTHYVPINAVKYEVEERDGAYYVEGILIVNKSYKLPKNFGGSNAEANKALSEMQAAAKKDGITLTVASGIRSYDSQKTIFENYAQREGGGSKGYEAAEAYSARPGHSEHQTGLAFDLVKASRSINGSKEMQWIIANCWKYGFINRYPAGKQDITGYDREDWHVRYVGKDWSKKIYESGLCLEEYFGLPSKFLAPYDPSDY